MIWGLGPSSTLLYHLYQHYFAAPLAGTLPDALGSTAQCLAAGSRGRGVMSGSIGGGWEMLVRRKTVTVVGGGECHDAALEAGIDGRIQERKGVDRSSKQELR
ncbi:unnamed protein product [Gongylonema pulchrum]|uniref:Uncharacterized protein n=1 Tax=Gongylonema pulchrum TaxID=637853 RepID=A0A183DQE6_9BILA|nr:unnamed protein product [Gongylonema pulchrum]